MNATGAYADAARSSRWPYPLARPSHSTAPPLFHPTLPRNPLPWTCRHHRDHQYSRIGMREGGCGAPNVVCRRAWTGYAICTSDALRWTVDGSVYPSLDEENNVRMLQTKKLPSSCPHTCHPLSSSPGNPRAHPLEASRPPPHALPSIRKTYFFPRCLPGTFRDFRSTRGLESWKETQSKMTAELFSCKSLECSQVALRWSQVDFRYFSRSLQLVSIACRAVYFS